VFFKTFIKKYTKKKVVLYFFLNSDLLLGGPISWGPTIKDRSVYDDASYLASREDTRRFHRGNCWVQCG